MSAMMTSDDVTKSTSDDIRHLRTGLMLLNCCVCLVVGAIMTYSIEQWKLVIEAHSAANVASTIAAAMLTMAVAIGAMLIFNYANREVQQEADRRRN